MKNLAKSFIIILGLGLISFQSNATEKQNLSEQNSVTNENPWEVFKETIYNYKTSNVKFLYTNVADQEAFLEAADTMKQKISERADEHAKQKLNRIEQTITMFKFLWEVKDDIQNQAENFEIIEAPEVQ
ncbi:hypothetical protein EGI22_18875 [Lacihabitans sp. LS3-19]|uniref:hypothetical protein n=1 Tax=Lacihabitans sp. LS3-19 TaxID=2487335 RepID=UPI0020CE0D08|nr:hypothetical protein [Lacihabitans sp. LS3-19]MCP9769973.1 hypothetical protein [Lacihabitans sp. LS3-19]